VSRMVCQWEKKKEKDLYDRRGKGGERVARPHTADRRQSFALPEEVMNAYRDPSRTFKEGKEFMRKKEGTARLERESEKEGGKERGGSTGGKSEKQYH